MEINGQNQNDILEFLSVDRIEEGIAVLENDDCDIIEVPLEDLPGPVREGDCLRLCNEGYIIDRDETERRQKFNIDLFNSLLQD